MSDPFVGTWALNPTRSAFDANHKPAEATMTWELDADGAYVLLAEGVDAKGERCEEKPQRLRPDGVAYPSRGLARADIRHDASEPQHDSGRSEARGRLARGRRHLRRGRRRQTMIASRKGSTRSCGSSRRRRRGIAPES